MYRPWPPAGFAVHDLAHLATLSDAPGLTLFVSPRTLYVLQNLAVAEATWQNRYASELAANGYFPVEEIDASWDLFHSVVDALKLEVLGVPDVIDKLDEILTRLNDVLLTGSHGSFLDAWIPDTPRLGYGGQRGHSVQNTDASAGVNYLYGATVPAEEVWVVENMAIIDENNSPGRSGMFVEYDGAQHVLKETPSLAASNWLSYNGRIIVHSGNRVGAYFVSCTAGDDIRLRVYAHKAVDI